MNRKFLSGTFGLVVTLALVGVAGTGETSSAEQASSERPQLAVDQPELQVPIRSGRAEDVRPSPGIKPVGLRIGDLDLDAQVVPVGVDAEQRLDVPSAELVGWYQYSPVPGTEGATVLAAHVDYGGEAGAFFNLHQLQLGEQFEVELEDGAVQTYEVTGNTTYEKTELPADELFRKSGNSALQLITCGGTFDPSEQSYEANVVISAVPI